MLAAHNCHGRRPRRPIKVAVLGSPQTGRSKVISRISLGSTWSICGSDGEDENLTSVTSSECRGTSLEFTMVCSTNTDSKDDAHERLVRSSDAFMLVYDVTAPHTFAGVQALHGDFFGPLEKGKPVWVCARGMFKPPEDRKISAEQGERFSEEIGAEFRCISIKERVGLDDSFAQEIAHRLFPDSIPALKDKNMQGPSQPNSQLYTVKE
ncbi:hypothetical protein B0J13DRAFT_564815 [Dactylonectria estremocensis]|uniref:Uncharacterized protein n=1 Tax=Dactylonectria estremocensis TaxID=1079267 RepID=A0A9P9DZS5_9HYPO|nr:hypothetical protein B0J13DRAFT_564815 [Dactylonectria estremocensis]